MTITYLPMLVILYCIIYFLVLTNEVYLLSASECLPCIQYFCNYTPLMNTLGMRSSHIPYLQHKVPFQFWYAAGILYTPSQIMSNAHIICRYDVHIPITD